MAKNKHEFAKKFSEAYNNDEKFRDAMISIFKAGTSTWSNYQIAEALVNVYEIKSLEMVVNEDNDDIDYDACKCCMIDIDNNHKIITDTDRCLRLIVAGVRTIRPDCTASDMTSIMHSIRNITFNISHKDIKVYTLFD